MNDPRTAFALGIKALEEDDFNSASEHFSAARDGFLREHDQNGAATSGLNLASAYEDMGRFDAALALLEEVSAEFAALDDEDGIAQCELLQGLVNEGLERFDVAIGHYERAISLFESLGDSLEAAATKMNLAGAFEAIGNSEEAKQLYESLIPTLIQLGAEAQLQECIDQAARLTQQAL